MDHRKTIVVIPTYNESDNIQLLLSAIVEFYPEISILVVDDNSPDGTAALVEKCMAGHPRIHLKRREKKDGLGRAYSDAFRDLFNSEYDTIITMDADLSHDFHAIQSMLALQSTHDLVIGSRYVRGGGIKNWKLFRRILSRLANRYVRFVLGKPINDLTSGFMCFSKKILETVHFRSIHSDGYAFLVEFKYLVLQSGFSAIEHPILFTERAEGQSKMSWRVILEAMIIPWKLRFSGSKNR